MNKFSTDFFKKNHSPGFRLLKVTYKAVAMLFTESPHKEKIIGIYEPYKRMQILHFKKICHKLVHENARI